jgi:hypothetical protein
MARVHQARIEGSRIGVILALINRFRIDGCSFAIDYGRIVHSDTTQPRQGPDSSASSDLLDGEAAGGKWA